VPADHLDVDRAAGNRDPKRRREHQGKKPRQRFSTGTKGRSPWPR
jgi:hypothetical protein